MIRASCAMSVGILAWIVLAQSARAEREVGNGGTGVVCFDANGQISSVEVYDYFEARTLRHAVIDLGDSSLSYIEQAGVALQRLAQYSPLRTNRYIGEVASFEQNANFLPPGISLPLIPDTGAIQLPDGCRLEQIVRQDEPRFPDDKRFVVDRDLWDQMDEQNKAGLVLHEVIYKEALGYGHETSVGTRYFNSLFAQRLSETLTYARFVQVLRSVPFVTTDFLGADFNIGSCRENPARITLSCPTPEAVVQWLPIEFYPSGNLKGFSTLLGVGTNQIGSPTEQLHFGSNRFEYTQSIPPAPFMLRFSFFDQRGVAVKSIQKISGYGNVVLAESNFGTSGALSEIQFDQQQLVASLSGQYIQFNQGVNGGGSAILRADGTLESISGNLGPFDFNGYESRVSGHIAVDRDLNWTSSDANLLVTIPNPQGKSVVGARPQNFEFGSDGTIKKVTTDSSSESSVKQQGINDYCGHALGKEYVTGNSLMTFFPNGNVESAVFYRHTFNVDKACVRSRTANAWIDYARRAWFDSDGWWVRVE